MSALAHTPRPPWATAPLLAMASSAGPAAGTDRWEDERVLLKRCQQGDPRAMQDLYQQHADRVHRRLTHLVGPVPEREDLLQEVFMALFSQLASFRGEASLATYLNRIAANKAYDHIRRRARRGAAGPLRGDLDEVANPGPSPEQAARRGQEAALLWRSLDQLKPKKRIAFILRVVEGHSLKEIAQQVGASVPTVAQRIRHARVELTELVQLDRRERSP